MPFTMMHLYHSTHFVPDLDEASEFFARVFGRESTLLGEYLGGGRREVVPGYARDYAVFTPIAEVLFESIDPTRLVVDGETPHENVPRPHLGGLAWFVDGIEVLWAELRKLGIRATGQGSAVHDGDDPPQDVSGTPIIFTVPSDTGISYELLVHMPRHDPRGNPPVPALSWSDPLGIECCSHHTVFTDQPDRALRLLVGVLGGRVVHEARNDALATQSTYIALADGIVELGRPLEDGSPAMDDLQRQAPLDSYHSITWKVRDLDQVADRLASAGVGIRTRTGSTIVTNAPETLGVPWGFTTELTPGDPRA